MCTADYSSWLVACRTVPQATGHKPFMNWNAAAEDLVHQILHPESLR